LFERALRVRGALLAACIVLLSGCAHLKSESDPLGNLLGLIDQRLALADDVARSKWNSGAPVEDLAREREIVDAIGIDAVKFGLEPDFAKTFFQAQIEASKIVQNARLAEWRTAQLPKFANAPDLQRDIRPQLDRLTQAMLDALAHALPALRTRDALKRLEARAAAGAAHAAAIAPLRRISIGP
jgi:chorismate mutase